MIKLTDVSKYYGKTTALSGITMSLDDTGIYCLLGRNGAGKTTLMKLIAGHLDASAGSIVVDGKKADMLHMPDSTHFIESGAAQFNMRLRKLFKTAAELNPEFDYDFALELGAKFKLNLDKRYKQLSFGMKVMANTILAMASNKKVLLLDEPTLGFDAVMRKTFYNLLQESVAERPKTVIISTHLIDEVATVAQKLLIIDNGNLLLSADMNDIDERAYSVTGPAPAVEEAVKGLHVIGETRAGGFVSKYVFDRRIEPGEQYTITALGLQDFFVSLVGGAEQEEAV